MFSVYKGRQEPLRIGYADERKAQQMVEQGFLGKRRGGGRAASRSASMR